MHRLRNFAGAVNLVGIHFFAQQRFQLLEKRVALIAVLGALDGKWMHRGQIEFAHEHAADKRPFAWPVSRAASVNSSAARWPADIFEVSISGPFFRRSTGGVWMVLIIRQFAG